MNTRQIQEKVANGETIAGLAVVEREVQIGPHQLLFSGEVLELTADHQLQIEEVLAQSLRQFPTETTRVQETIGLPTILARADCTITAEGVGFYECEERPAGLGILSLLNKLHLDRDLPSLFQSHSVATLGAELAMVRHPQALPSDDALAFEVFDDVSATNGHVVIARGEPAMFDDEAAYRLLAEKSASTIRTEGDKMYTTRVADMGSRLITSVEELPDRDESFVLKTKQGSKSKGVKVYLAKSDQANHGDKGTITHGRMQRFCEENAPLILDGFKPPIRLAESGNMVLRVSALVSPDRIEVIGGVYVARPEMLVHGASNAVSGLITVEGER